MLFKHTANISVGIVFFSETAYKDQLYAPFGYQTLNVHLRASLKGRSRIGIIGFQFLGKKHQNRILHR